MPDDSRIADVPISLIGLPYHMGVRYHAYDSADRSEPSQFGMARGPELLLTEENVPRRLRQTFNDVSVELLTDVDDATDRERQGDYRRFIRGDQMNRLLIQNMRLAGAVRDALAAGRIPIVSAGNCTAALGMVGGIDDADLGMIWIDAHSDAMTPDTTMTGMMDGMPVSTIAGMCWPRYREQIPGFHVIPPHRIVTIGNHEIYSEGARKALGDAAIGARVDPPVIERLGFTSALEQVLDQLSARVDRVYVHFDADVMDPSVLRGNNHCAPGGLTLEQATEAFEAISERVEIAAVAFTAFDADEDPRGPDVLVPIVAAATAAAARSLHRRVAVA